ncbi:MAG: type II secretion system protein J, partial [Lachnospiraceae bacterium]
MNDLFVAKKNKRNSGFSLVELVVAIGILAVISTIVA